MADNDITAQSEAQPEVVAEAAVLAEPVADGYGTITAAINTVITRVCPPKKGFYSRVNGLQYDNGATEHTLTMMVMIKKVKVASEAAKTQAVLVVDALPTNYDGSAFAADDWLIVVDELGIYGAYKIASVSGLSITITTSVGSAGASGFVNKIPKGAFVWLMGAPADHSTRQYKMKASAVTTFPESRSGYCTSPGQNEPLLIHSDNTTAAAKWTYLNFSNVKL